MKSIAWFSLLLAFLGIVEGSRAQNVVINEIMYHPSSENPREEYVELFNNAATNVNLSGWRISGGIDFLIPTNTTIVAGRYLVVAADRAAFLQKYPGVSPVVGGWLTVQAVEVVDRQLTNHTPVLSNRRNTVNLDTAAGEHIDSVTYADEGDWAVRQRGPNDRGYRGWIWFKEHDGAGKSLELINANLPNEHGQNWAASIPINGTPGQANSVISANIAPMILETGHLPAVPRSTDDVSITCRVLDESLQNLIVRLHWRVSSASPPEFANIPMLDDGQHADGLAGDGIYGAYAPAQPSDTVVEFYVEASDGQGHARTWPGPAIGAPDDGSGPTGQVVNALYQVDDNPLNDFGSPLSLQPVYKLIMTESERAELETIPSQSSNNGPDSQMNATFISLDAQGTEVRYGVGVRNRGHGSRRANPPNYRVNFNSDRSWKGVIGINLNSRQVHIQHLGSVLANKAGAIGTYSRAVQIRVNNANLATSGAPMFGSYAANEVYDGDWAERHLPLDSGGNLYKAVRDLPPSPDPRMDYRGEDSAPYKRTYVKESNVSEDDWQDLIGMLAVMATNGPVEFTTANARAVINVEQWLTHMAVMALFANGESGLYTGNNDDYYMYRGVNDPRFMLLYHDLDQILGAGSLPPNTDIFRSTCCSASGDTEGSWRLMNRFLHWPDFEPLYYATLQRLLDTTFSQPQFDALVDQTLGGYAPNPINGIKDWMNQRRTYVQDVINGHVPPPGFALMATISGEPRSPTPMKHATFSVGGQGVVAYRYKLNNGLYGAETPVATAITLNNLTNGTYTVSVLGKTSSNTWQSVSTPTLSRAWIVNTSLPAVRINEVLARNDSVLNHQGTFPDLIELYNEDAASVDLSGLRLTDDPGDPEKFTFPNGTTLAAGDYLILYANDPDGTAGIHLGFNLEQNGEGVFLFAEAEDGGALLDSVRFGPQVANLSVGRLANAGRWTLTQPTFGAANLLQPQGDELNVKINEWLAAPQNPFPEDFIELYNPDSLPVDLGGLYLTDAPIGAPGLHRITDLTFVPANGFLSLIADDNASRPDHVGFRLNSDVGEIGLFSRSLAAIDCVIYGPQKPGISMGRCLDGAVPIRTLVLSTPGSGNACPTEPPLVEGVTLVAITNVWRYNDTGADLGTSWRTLGYNDSGWPQGPGVLGQLRDGGSLPEPVRTQITIGSPRITFYFRAHLNLPANHGYSAIQIRHIIDDGAVFYLNGAELFRYNMPGGEILSTTLALENILDAGYEGPMNVPLDRFVPGDNVFAVEVHQANPNSADIHLGLVLSGITATNNPADAGVVINEIFANNGTLANTDGSTPDWAELYNPSQTLVDLTGMSLVDSTGHRWIFPAGSVIPPLSYFTVRMDGDKPASATNTGFGLSATGDVLTLYNKAPLTNSPVSTRNFGLQTADFSIGRVPSGGDQWTLTLPTIGSANLPASLGSVSQLRINEWLADPPPGDDDWFEVYNPSPQPVDISLCYLSDSQNTWRLPSLCYIGAVTNAWQEFIADDNTQAGADHVPFRLSASGDSLRLANSNSVPIDFVTFNNQQPDVSQGRLPDGASNILRFPGTQSPGGPNFAPLTNVVINEVVAHTDLPLEDAIELHNPTASLVNIGGWWLSDARSSPRKFQIPDGMTIPARGFKVFYEYEFNDPDQAVMPFALSSASGDEVFLSAVGENGVLTGYRARADFGPSANGVSFGRYQTSVGIEFTAMSALTLGTSVNAQSPTNQISLFRTGEGASNSYPEVGPVIISEISYHPPDLGTNDNVPEEFIELRNITAISVPLYDTARPTNGWRLRDAVDFDFNSGHSIPGNGHVAIVSFDPAMNPTALAAFQARYGSNAVVVGPYSGKLDNGSDSVELYRPDPPQIDGGSAGLVPYVLVDKVHYQDRLPWPTNNVDGFGYSLQRLSATGYGNDPTNWFAAPPAIGGSGSMDGDSDGMPDDWEMTYSFDKDNPDDANQDPDQDGLTNLEEYLSGTHPRDANDYLKVISVVMVGGQPRLRFIAVAGKTYTLQYRNSFSAGSWVKLADIPAQATTGNREVMDITASSMAQRFYRLITPTAP